MNALMRLVPIFEEFSVMKTVKTILIVTLLLFVARFSGFSSDKKLYNSYKTVEVIPLKNTMLSVGDVAPNIILKGKGGKKQLEKLRGKIVLIKFWASWCLPCRKTNPQWLNVYNNYQKAKFTDAKGFEIFAVSLDEKKKAWKKAIKADGLNYKNNTIDKKGWNSSYAFIYGISQLPGYFLLDTEGVILAINPRPSEVQSILQERLR